MNPSPSQADTEARFVAEIQRHMRRTFGPRVLEDKAPVGGLFSLDYDTRLFTKNYRRPVLVSSVSGVGAKLPIAQMLDRHDTIGVDLVANAMNHIAARGAEPLFFAAYLESAHLDPQRSFPIVKGIADACALAECAFIELATPERPAAFRQGEYYLAGFGLGVAERSRLVAHRAVKTGDVLVALPSSGLHVNGHTLARRIFFDKLKMSPATQVDEIGCAIGQELIRPTAVYAKAVKRILRHYRVKKVVRGIVCVGDGGLRAAAQRILPGNVGADVQLALLPPQPIFDLIRRLGELDQEEMFDVFNMGVGMLLLVAPFYAASIIRRLRRAKQPACVIGQVCDSPKGVRFV